LYKLQSAKILIIILKFTKRYTLFNIVNSPYANNKDHKRN
ncbi:MAG: hypothetical protein JWO03_1576, partial [Bacteroidetes bacterium]|nr:hypothetical protein [Bacteroidota bacterium]